ncbi:RING-type domain-containing protein [Aphelenchoides besseyi]|nr:RING-type domain-containing protein [Aphelenchoides besseyi]
MRVFQCSICIDPLTKPCILNTCKHVFCNKCIKEWQETFRGQKLPTCPYCRLDFSRRDVLRLKVTKQQLYDGDTKEKLLDRSHEIDVKQNWTTKRIELTSKKKIKQQETTKLQEKLAAINKSRDKLDEKTIERQRKIEIAKSKAPLLSTLMDDIYQEIKTKNGSSLSVEPNDQVLSAWKNVMNEYSQYLQIEKQLTSTQKKLADERNRYQKYKRKYGAMDRNELASRFGPKNYAKLCKIMNWPNLEPVTPPIAQQNRTKLSVRPLNIMQSRKRMNLFDDADDLDICDSGIGSIMESTSYLDEAPVRRKRDQSPIASVPSHIQNRVRKATRSETERNRFHLRNFFN